MAVICKEKKLLFLLNPRTGSSALGEHLINEFGGEWLPKERYFDNTIQKHIDFKHNTISELLEFNLFTNEELNDLIVFTSVCNPYYSLLTLYRKYKYRYEQWRKEGRHFLQDEKIQKEIDFCKNNTINKWIFKNLWKSSIKSFLKLEKLSLNKRFVSKQTFVLKEETLQEDFKKFLEENNINGNSTIPVTNKTESKGEGINSLNFISKILIYVTYREDFIKYKYKF